MKRGCYLELISIRKIPGIKLNIDGLGKNDARRIVEMARITTRQSARVELPLLATRGGIKRLIRRQETVMRVLI